MRRPELRDETIQVWKVFLVVVIGSSGISPAHGEGLRNFADGWLLSCGDMAIILSSARSTAAVHGVGGLQEDTQGWGLWAGAGQGQLFSMDDLPLTSAECGIIHRNRRLAWSLTLAWERLGQKLMVEDAGALSLRLGTNPQAAVRVRSRRWLISGEEVATNLETDLEGRFFFALGTHLGGNIAFWLHPGELPYWHSRGGRRSLAEVKIFPPGCGMSLRIDQRTDGVPVFSLEVMGRLTSLLGLGFRGDPETGTLGGSLVFRLAGLWLHTSHLVHPNLGLTHRFHLGTGDPGASAW